MKKRYLIGIFMILISFCSYGQWNDTEKVLNIKYWNNLGVGDADYGYFGMCLRYNNNQWESFHSTLNGMAMKFAPNGINFITAPANTIQANITTLLRINSNGNIGIGTNTVNHKLDIRGDVGFYNSGVDGTLGSALFFGNSNLPTSYRHKIQSSVSLNPTLSTMIFSLSSGATTQNDILTLKGDGKVGIGTNCPKYKLDVLGTIRVQEVIVDLLGGCDFVFKSDYKLMDLKELEQFVKTNQHLPEIAPEKEMIENGVNMKELQMKLLQKIEELTLYTIKQNKEIEKQNTQLQKPNEKITELKKQNDKIKALEEKIEKIETALK